MKPYPKSDARASVRSESTNSGKGYSIQAQLNLLRDYAAEENLEILKEFIDVETAKVAGRMQFNAMLAFEEDTELSDTDRRED